MPIHLTTNMGLQGYEKRIGKIAEIMGDGKELYGIEIFLIPGNYENKFSLEFPEDRREIETTELPSGAKSYLPVLSQPLAKDIGKIFENHNTRKVQIHYPWEKSPIDMHGMHWEETINFGDTISEYSGAMVQINHHVTLKYPTGNITRNKSGEDRKSILNMAELITTWSSDVRDQMGSHCKIIVENNSSAGKLFDKKTSQWIVDNIDFVAEDYVYREGIDGNNWDYSHAWCAIGALNGERTCPTMEWCKCQYNGIPESGKSIQNYARKVAPNIEWIHIGDEASPYAHYGLHIGETRNEGGKEVKGNINFNECVDALGVIAKENPKKDLVATLEFKDGHLPEGFEKIKNHDYPFLKNLLENAGILAYA